MKYINIILILVFYNTIAQEKWTLEKCLHHAKKNSLEIVKQQLQNNVADNDIKRSKGNFFPDLSLNASQGFTLGNSFNVSTGVGQLESRFNSFSLNASLNVFNAFSSKYKLQEAKLNLEKGKLDLKKIQLDLSEEITKRYLTVLFNKEILTVAKQQLDITKQDLDVIKKLVNAALKPKTELLEIQATYQNNNKELILATNKLDNSLISLKELLDIKNIRNFDIETIDTTNTNTLLYEKNMLNTAIENNPTLNASLTNTQIKQKQLQIAKTNLYPKVNFNYSYNTNYFHILGQEDLVFNQETGQFEENGFFTQLQNNLTHFLSLGVTIPVFNKLITKTEINKKEIDLEVSQIEFENQKKELNNKIQTLLNNIQDAQASYEASKTALQFQKQAFKINRSKYNKGLINLNDYLTSKIKFIQATSELIKAKYELLLNKKILSFYIESNP